MALILLCLLLQPSDSIVITQIQSKAGYHPHLWSVGVEDVKGVVIVEQGRRMYWKRTWGYPYKVVIVGTDCDNDPWVWCTAYWFYWEDDKWKSYNDEKLEDKMEKGREVM